MTRQRGWKANVGRIGVVAMIAVISAASAAEAQNRDQCESDAAGAVASWTSRSGGALTPAAKSTITKKFCDAVDRVRPQAEPRRLASAATPVIGDYLDAQTTLTVPAKTISAGLSDYLGVSGLSRPAVRDLGIVSVKLVHAPNELWVGGEKVSLFPKLIVTAGDNIPFKGLRGTALVCQGQFSLVGGGTADLVC